MGSEIKLEPSWKHQLQDEFCKPYMQKLREFLRKEKDNRKIIYPNSKDIFSAFSLTPFDKVKVVILGQDPYHGPNQAHGLCFSVQPGIKTPPSLKNIYQELQQDVGISVPNHGNLEYWAIQGVLLLNSVLTVERSKAGSHQGKGWEQFTDAVIAKLNAQNRPIIFVLWGKYAQQKGSIIDTTRHEVLTAAHPSPFSATKFFGCKHFSKINNYLQSLGDTPIDWKLPELEIA